MREKQLDQWRSIQTLRRMLGAIEYQPGRKSWGSAATRAIGEMRDELRAVRRLSRPVQSPKTFVERLSSEIERDTRKAIDKVMEKVNRRRTNNPLKHETLITKTGHGKVSKYGNTYSFNLRCGWYRNVYLKLLVGDLLKNVNMFPLKATEFKTNAKGIRLFSVIAYNFMTAKEMHGYIAQSKLDDKCVFHLTVPGAITAATGLTLASVNDKLGVKDNNNG